MEKALNDGATVDSILAALAAEKTTLDWMTANGQYVPGIVKWLEREPWRNYVADTVSTEAIEDKNHWVSR